MAWKEVAEVFKHYGVDIEKAKANKEEFDFVIYSKEDAEEVTGNMAGFRMNDSQQVIIDFDKDFDRILVRRIKKNQGALECASARTKND